MLNGLSTARVHDDLVIAGQPRPNSTVRGRVVSNGEQRARRTVDSISKIDFEQLQRRIHTLAELDVPVVPSQCATQVSLLGRQVRAETSVADGGPQTSKVGLLRLAEGHDSLTE